MFASPSSRRAWIEYRADQGRRPCPAVALLTEGVDRNWNSAQVNSSGGRRSPSSRRAWIEMLLSFGIVNFASVALLTEGVDRNL